MFANSLRPLGRAYRMTPSHVETVAGCVFTPPKSRQATGLRRAAVRLGRRALGDGFAVRRDDFRQGIIPMDTPKKETPRHEARGAVRACEDTNTANRTAPTSIRQAAWWGQQACSCRGEGKCLCCRRFDRAIRAHQARMATAGGC